MGSCKSDVDIPGELSRDEIGAMGLRWSQINQVAVSIDSQPL